MKHSQIKTNWRRLIAGLLISAAVPFLGLARNQSGEKVPAGFNYRQAQETIKVEVEIESRSLSGRRTLALNELVS